VFFEGSGGAIPPRMSRSVSITSAAESTWKTRLVPPALMMLAPAPDWPVPRIFTGTAA
jgi:hypothetical protein